MNHTNSLHDSLCSGAVWNMVLGALEEVVTQEQSSQWVLHTTTHLNQVFEDISPRTLLSLDIHCSHGDQQVPVC